MSTALRSMGPRALPVHIFVGVMVALLGVTGCVGGTESTGPNLAPQSLEEAELTLGHIDAMLETDPNDPEAWEMLEVLRPRLDELNHLVAEVDMGPGHSIRFFEVEPGIIGVSESAPEGVARVLTHQEAVTIPVTELYERFAHEPAPASLVDAQAREVALADTMDLDDETPAFEELGAGPDAQPELVPSIHALTSGHGSYFRDNYCFTSGEFRGCYPNWGGNVYAQASTKTSFLSVAPYYGTVSVRLQYSGSTRFTDAVFQGEVASYSWRSSSYRTNGALPFSPRDYRRRTHRWDVLHASGNYFHWTHAFRWNCSYTSCNSYPR